MGGVQSVRPFVAAHGLALLTLLGAAIRFGTIGVQGFWLDEQVTVSLIQLGPIDLLRQVIASESNPALYYLAAGGWERLFGDSEFAIRSLTALAGTAAIPVIYAAANELYSRRAGMIAAALTATSPLLVWYSGEARNYEFLVLLAALGLLCFVRALSETGHRWLWAWALVSSLALATHYFAVFAIVPEAAWLLWSRRGRRLDTLIPMGAIAIVGLALLPLLAAQRGRGDWIEAYGFGGRLVNVAEHFAVGYYVPWPALPAIVLAAVGLVAGAAVIGGDRRLREALAMPATVAAGGLGLLLIAVVAGDDYLLSRNLLELWPMVAVGLAIALASPRLGRWGVATAGAVCMLGVWLVIWSALTPATHRQDYHELAEELGAAPTARLIVSQSSFSSPLILALDDARAAANFDLLATELIVVEPLPTDDYAVGTCLWLPTCGGVDVEPPPRFEPPPGFTLAREGQTETFGYAVYSAPVPTAIQRPVEYYTPRVFRQEAS
jgi:mannosyltransferase